MKKEVSIAFQTDKTAAQYIALARLVNQYDFDAVSVYCDAPYHPPYVPLMLMAPHIEHARIGVAAVPPSRIGSTNELSGSFWEAKGEASKAIR